MGWNSSSAHRTAFVLVEEAWVVRALLVADVLHAVAERHVPVASRNRVAVEVAHLAAVEYTLVVGLVSVWHPRIDLLDMVGPITLAEGLSDVSPPWMTRPRAAAYAQCRRTVTLRAVGENDLS